MGKFRQFYHPVTHPYFCFRPVTCVNFNRFSPNLICALIFWRSGLGFLKGKLCQFFIGLSACDMLIVIIIFSHFFFFYCLVAMTTERSL